MLEYLSSKPLIGVFSGFGSGAIAIVQNTEPSLVAQIGMYAGTFVAVITGILKLIEAFDTIKRRIKSNGEHK